MSCGYELFCGPQVASRINVALLSPSNISLSLPSASLLPSVWLLFSELSSSMFSCRLNYIIISLISSRMSSVRRLRNPTSNDGTTEVSYWYPAVRWSFDNRFFLWFARQVHGRRNCISFEASANRERSVAALSAYRSRLGTSARFLFAPDYFPCTYYSTFCEKCTVMIGCSGSRDILKNLSSHIFIFL